MATHDTVSTKVSGADPKRRKLLIATASVIGGAGVVATSIPFIQSW